MCNLDTASEVYVEVHWARKPESVSGNIQQKAKIYGKLLFYRRVETTSLPLVPLLTIRMVRTVCIDARGLRQDRQCCLVYCNGDDSFFVVLVSLDGNKNLTIFCCSWF